MDQHPTDHITFRKAQEEDRPLLHSWLAKPYIAELWDENGVTPEHGLTRKDLEAFTKGEDSIFAHWIAYFGGDPYAYIMTSNATDPEVSHLRPYLETTGETLTLDYMIGEENYLGKGLSAPTLQAFIDQLPTSITALLTDPETKNTKAIHVYEKAGFQKVADYSPSEGPFQGVDHIILKFVRPS